MKESVKEELIAIVGPERATDRPEDLVAYSLDPYTQENRPDIVLYPDRTEEVSSIMKVAHREGIPVTPRGSGTNLAGETVPVQGGIVLAFSRMDRILEIDRENRLARIQPGVINFEFQQEVEKHGLMYPPDPSSWKMATMGGTVGTNAGGPKTVKYGVTRDYLLGLKVVLANGDVLKTGGRAIKNVTGYDLTRLICGSEGTLGVVTEIIVRLVPKPLANRTIMASFPKLEDSSDAVAAIIGAGIVPACLELMDKTVISAVEADAKLGLPTDVDAILLVEVDGDPESLDGQVKKIRGILQDKRAATVTAASSREEADKLWAARRGAIPAMARLRPNARIEDATVPVSRMTAMIRKIMEISKKYDVQIGVLAHAGDGNLHPLILFDARNQDEMRRVEQATEEIFREAVTLGGTLTGEHGIGLAKKRFLPMEIDEVGMSVTKRIKESLDPKGILNPGKFV
ncbi:MAG: FAD-linked oxidase C-terminal domain-containing protein [Thermodesulfobacteriota bacterium]